MLRATGSLVKYPARVAFLWYLGVILAGSLLLQLPVCHAPGRPSLSVLDSVFTIASATCVTGLTVRSTEFDLSWVGQLLILAHIQIGGIGILTITTLVLFRLGASENLRHRALITETLGAPADASLSWVLREVIVVSVIVESLGAAILFVRWIFIEPPSSALWHAVFHSVSAYCNAGFSLWDDNLTRYQDDWVVNLTIAALVIVGGIGFPVILDVRRLEIRGLEARSAELHLHARLMLIGTVFLLVFGTVWFLVLEWRGVLADLPVSIRLLAAFFHSMTPRTAGFNTLPVKDFTDATLLMTIVLMAIGGGPGSTAGGFKVSTAMVLACRGWATLRGFSRINIFRRSIPQSTVDKAIATAIIFSLVALFSVSLMLVVEQNRPSHQSHRLFLEVLFECVSALGTVGLSTGITPHLTDAGKLILIVLMFMGRLGPISVFAALSRSERRQSFEFVPEEPLIG